MSFFSASLNLNEVSLKKRNDSIANLNDHSFSLNQISIGIDIPKSYLQRKVVVKNIVVIGLELKIDELNNLKNIFPNNKNENNNKNQDTLSLIKEFMPKIPNKFTLINSKIIYGDVGKINYDIINIVNLEAEKFKIDNKFYFKINGNLSQSTIKNKNLKSEIKINQLLLSGDIFQNGLIEIKKFDAKSNIADINTSLSFKLNNDFKKSSYIGQLNSLKIYNSNFFPLVDMHAFGEINIEGDYKSGNSLLDLPLIVGKVNWKKTFLNDISLYNGHSNFNIKNKILYYENAFIITEKKAEITSNGRFELFNNFKFENIAKINNFKFSELMSGFGVSHSYVDFNLNSDELKVNGIITSPNHKKNFELSVVGLVQNNQFKVISFIKDNRKNIAPFQINLNLDANSQELIFDHSKMHFLNDRSNLDISNGKIDFSEPLLTGVLFNFKATDLDLSNLDYFLKMETNGNAQVEGVISNNLGHSNVYFEGLTNVLNAKIMGLSSAHLKTNLRIDSDAISAEKFNFNGGNNENKIAKVTVDNFKFNFNTNELMTEVESVGNLNGLILAIQDWIPVKFLTVDGNLRKFNLKFLGDVFHPKLWNLKTNFDFDQVNIWNGIINSLNLNLNCSLGKCNNSYFIMKNIHLKANNGNPPGQVYMQIDNLSFDDASIKAQINDFPLEIFDLNADYNISGYLNSSNSLFGNWSKINTVNNLNINNFKIGKYKFGDTFLNLSSNAQSNLTFQMKALNNQFNVYAKINDPKNLRTNVSVVLNKLNLSSIFPKLNNFYTQLIGSFHFDGELSSSIFSNPILFLNSWKGSGQLTHGNIQFDNLIMNLNSNDSFILNKNKISIPELNLKNNLVQFSINSNALIDLNKSILSLPVSLNLNLENLNSIYPSIFEDSCSGNINGQVNLSGNLLDPIFDGTLNLIANRIYLKNDPQFWKNVVGEVIFKNKLIEIRKISANKGHGEVSIAGQIDLSKQNPNLNLKLSTTNADFRFSLPMFIFTNADLNIDSDISLTGDKAPYLISGNANINQLKLIRNLTCDQIYRQANSYFNLDHSENNLVYPNINLNLKANRSIDIETQCLQGLFSIDSVMNVFGPLNSPSLNGTFLTSDSTFQIFKSKFNIQRANIQFVESQKYDPIVNVQMTSKIENYNIDWKLNGRLSEASPDNLTADPPVLLNGDTLSVADIINMIYSGHVPLQSSPASFISSFSVLILGDLSMDRSVSALTGGLIEDASLGVSSQNGQFGLKANISRSIFHRLNLGLAIDAGSSGNAKTIYANFILNNSLSIIGSYNTTNYIQQISTQEFVGGLRFQFGSR